MRILKSGICFAYISLLLSCIMGCQYYQDAGMGCRWLSRGEYDKAIYYLTRAISVEPNRCEAYYWRSIAYIEKDDGEKALSDLNKAIELNPSYYEALCSRGNFYQERGEFKLALGDFNTATSLKPHYYYTYLCMGRLYHKHLNDYPKALDEYNKALDIEPTNSVVIVERGRLFYDMKDYKKAFSEFEKFSNLYPDEVRCCNDYAWLLIMCPDLKYRDANKALILAKKAVDKKPCSITYDTLSGVYAEKNDFRNAIFFQEKAVYSLNTEMMRFENSLANYKKSKVFLSELKERLNLYKNNKKWKELPGERRYFYLRTRGIDYGQSPPPKNSEVPGSSPPQSTNKEEDGQKIK